ncbi:MAG: hypothetical protein DKM50_01590 [Candidatus Margulisiibacteriota bacterium]|nr:MAG: hypothetical protein DKM50_01590 [Candidatus Margulisiibacteriota bacterium]
MGIRITPIQYSAYISSNNNNNNNKIGNEVSTLFIGAFTGGISQGAWDIIADDAKKSVGSANWANYIKANSINTSYLSEKGLFVYKNGDSYALCSLLKNDKNEQESSITIANTEYQLYKNTAVYSNGSGAEGVKGKTDPASVEKSIKESLKITNVTIKDNGDQKISIDEILVDGKQVSKAFWDSFVDGGEFGDNDSFVTDLEIQRAADMMKRGKALGYDEAKYFQSETFTRYNSVNVGNSILNDNGYKSLADDDARKKWILENTGNIIDINKLNAEIDAISEAMGIKGTYDLKDPNNIGYILGRIHGQHLNNETYKKAPVYAILVAEWPKDAVPLVGSAQSSAEVTKDIDSLVKSAKEIKSVDDLIAKQKECFQLSQKIAGATNQAQLNAQIKSVEDFINQAKGKFNVEDIEKSIGKELMSVKDSYSKLDSELTKDNLRSVQDMVNQFQSLVSLLPQDNQAKYTDEVTKIKESMPAKQAIIEVNELVKGQYKTAAEASQAYKSTLLTIDSIKDEKKRSELRSIAEKWKADNDYILNSAPAFTLTGNPITAKDDKEKTIITKVESDIENYFVSGSGWPTLSKGDWSRYVLGVDNCNLVEVEKDGKKMRLLPQGVIDLLSDRLNNSANDSWINSRTPFAEFIAGISGNEDVIAQLKGITIVDTKPSDLTKKWENCLYAYNNQIGEGEFKDTLLSDKFKPTKGDMSYLRNNLLYSRNSAWIASREQFLKFYNNNQAKLAEKLKGVISQNELDLLVKSVKTASIKGNLEAAVISKPVITEEDFKKYLLDPRYLDTDKCLPDEIKSYLIGKFQNDPAWTKAKDSFRAFYSNNQATMISTISDQIKIILNNLDKK